MEWFRQIFASKKTKLTENPKPPMSAFDLNDTKAIDDFSRQLRDLSNLDFRDVSPNEIQKHLQEVMGTIPRGYSFDDRRPLYRGRKLKNKEEYYPSIKQMREPEEKYATQQRASFPNDPVFYGSFSIPTICNELDLQTGNRLQVIHCEIKQGADVRLYPIGDHESIANSGTSLYYPDGMNLLKHYHEQVEKNPDMMFKLELLDKFLSSIFRVRGNKQDSEHKLTSAVSWHIRKDFVGIDGILYPSVEVSNALNVLIKPEIFDKNFEVIASMVYEVKSCGFNSYRHTEIAHTKNITKNGDFEW